MNPSPPIPTASPHPVCPNQGRHRPTVKPSKQPPPTQPQPAQTATTDLTKDVTEQLSNEQQADDNSLPPPPSKPSSP